MQQGGILYWTILGFLYFMWGLCTSVSFACKCVDWLLTGETYSDDFIDIPLETLPSWAGSPPIRTADSKPKSKEQDEDSPPAAPALPEEEAIAAHRHPEEDASAEYELWEEEETAAPDDDLWEEEEAAFDLGTAIRAAELGDLDLLERTTDGGRLSRCSLAVTEAAVRGGQLDVLDWARQRGYWCDPILCRMAAEQGNSRVLSHLRELGCPWDASTCAAAAAWGHLEILQWARASGCPWDEHTVLEADFSGQWGLLAWALSQGAPVPNSLQGERILSNAARRRGVTAFLASAAKSGPDSTGLPFLPALARDCIVGFVWTECATRLRPQQRFEHESWCLVQ